MPRRDKIKHQIADFAGSFKGLFGREDQAMSGASTPSVTQAHTSIPTPASQTDSLELMIHGNSLLAQELEPSGPTLQSTVPITGDHPVTSLSSQHAQKVSATAAGVDIAIITEQVAPRSRELGNADANVSSSHIRSDSSNTAEQSAHRATQQSSREPSVGKDMRLFARGIAKSAADVLKVGPLQDVFDLFGDLGDTYRLEGTAEKEYEALRQLLQTVLSRLDNEFDMGSPSTPSGIEDLRKSIQKELKEVRDKQGRSEIRRYLEASKEVNEIQACYRRVAGYSERLTFDISLKMKKLAEEQSKSRLSCLPAAPSAWYDSGAGAELKRGGCTPGTRIEVLANVLGWVNNGNKSGMYWLNGMAGTGKTTIAYSVCRELDRKRTLAASFFCSRLRGECRDVNTIIPSIAYQLARFSLPFQLALSAVLENDPGVHAKQLPIQFQALIQEPLLVAEPLPTHGLVVVIDALDECENKESTRDILNMFLNQATDLPIRFIVSSRPEPQICDEMTNTRAKSGLVLHELDKGEVQADIEKYLREGLAPMSPSDEQIAALAEKAGILFIYAATAVRYISYDRFRSDPEDRLHDILGGPLSAEQGGSNEMDELYRTILETALDNPSLRKAQQGLMRQVLDTVICAREPLTVVNLSGLLEIKDAERVRKVLRPLWSVLHVMEESELVTTLHASFPDFLLDSKRSKTYWCDSEAHHLALAKQCLEHISRTQPYFNICNLESSYLPDLSVPDLESRVAGAISLVLLYACRYWTDHVKAANNASSVAEQMRNFLSTRLLLWMEVLNLNNHMKAGRECMRLVAGWCKTFEGQKELAELAQDSKRFVEAFAANPVSQSTPHIYVSMLAFWPKSAPIAKHYVKYTRGPVEAEGTALDRRQLAHLSTWAFEKEISAIAVAPDGRYLALACANGVLIVDSSSGRVVLGPLQGHPVPVSTVAFSSDGLRIFSGSFNPKDATILGWETRTSDAVLGPLHLKGHTDEIICLSISPDFSRIATGSDDKTACLWDAQTGKILHQLIVHDTVWAVAFSPDGTRVAAASEDSLQVWDSQDGHTIIGPVTDINMGSINKIALSPKNDHIICAATYGKSILIGEIQNNSIMFRQIAKHPDNINCLAYSSDGKQVVTGSGDRAVRIWDAQSGSMVLGPLEGHTGDITSVAFSSDDSTIISACKGGLVCTWNAQHQTLTPCYNKIPSNRITCARFSPDGACFISGSDEGTISTWNDQTGEIVLGPVKIHAGPIYLIDFKNHRVVSGSEDRKLCVCDARGGGIVLGPLQVRLEAIEAITYSPCGNLIATGSYLGVDVWNSQDGGRVLGPLTDLDSTVSSVRFSPDGTRIVAGSWACTLNIAVWDVSDRRRVLGIFDGHHDSVWSVSYSPNGALIASCSSDRTVILWDASTGKKAIGPLIGHSDAVLSISFSPDSTRLVSGSLDRTIRIWDTQTGGMVFKLLHGHEDFITLVEYSPDGTRIMSLSYDMSVRIHDARSPDERARSRSESEVGDWTMDKDGWVVDDESRLLVWVPGDLRKALVWPRTRVRVPPFDYVQLKFDKSRMGESWASGFTSHQ